MAKPKPVPIGQQILKQIESAYIKINSAGSQVEIYCKFSGTQPLGKLEIVGTYTGGSMGGSVSWDGAQTFKKTYSGSNITSASATLYFVYNNDYQTYLTIQQSVSGKGATEYFARNGVCRGSCSYPLGNA